MCPFHLCILQVLTCRMGDLVSTAKAMAAAQLGADAMTAFSHYHAVYPGQTECSWRAQAASISSDSELMPEAVSNPRAGEQVPTQVPTQVPVYAYMWLPCAQLHLQVHTPGVFAYLGAGSSSSMVHLDHEW